MGGLKRLETSEPFLPVIATGSIVQRLIGLFHYQEKPQVAQAVRCWLPSGKLT